MAFEIRIHEVNPGDAVRRDGATLLPWATSHRVTSVGWVLQEDMRPGRFHPERAREAGVPEGELWGELQRGRPVTLTGGRVVHPGSIVDPPRRGRRVAVTGDTRPCPETAAAARGADLLVHECTFGDAEADRAVETTHSTAREAGRMAREAGVARLVLTHLSTRYDTVPGPLLEQAAQEYAGPIDVARDGLVLEMARAE
jgi:ribonuclease Z